MPYTFLHPGFALPFSKWFPRILYMPALIIGSFVPDLDIIYRFSETRYHLFSYSTENIVFVLIPMGVVLTYFLQIVSIPISSNGKWSINADVIKTAVFSLPKIIFCVGIAIVMHVFLDQYAHFDDAKGLSLRIGENLGYELSEMDRIYQILLYLPQLIISGLGLVLTSISLFILRKDLLNTIQFLLKHLFLSLFLAAIICVSFASMKVIKAGVEQGMEIDSLLIGITCGLMSAFLLTPIAVWLLLKISARQYILLPMIFTFSIYMLGLVFKEYLATYILRGLFVSVFSFIALVILHSNRTDWKDIAMLFLYLFCTPIHPFSSYFTFMLLFNFGLLVILMVLKSHLNIYILCIIRGLVIGSTLSLAYYASDKGLGPGILVIYAIGLAYSFSQNTIFSTRTLTVFSLISKILVCLIIISVKPQLGVFALVLLLFITLLQFITKRITQDIADFIFFVIGISLTAITYISLEFSLLYGVFSTAQILLILTLTYNTLNVNKGNIKILLGGAVSD